LPTKGPTPSGFPPDLIGGIIGHAEAPEDHFGEMRQSGVRGVLIYCADYKCSHWTAVNADQWSDDVRLSDGEDKFVCTVCGQRGADVRPDFGWDKKRGAGS